MDSQSTPNIDFSNLPLPNLPKNISFETLYKLRVDHKLSYGQIAKIVGCSKANVLIRLSKIDSDEVHFYRKNRESFFQSLQFRLLNSITDEEIKKAPLGSKVLAAAQIYDKERLETGQSTENQAVVLGVDPGLRQSLGKVKGRYGKGLSPTQKVSDNPISALDNNSNFNDDK